MADYREPDSTHPVGPVAKGNFTWRRVAKAYVFLHAIVCLCMCAGALGGARLIPKVPFSAIAIVAELGFFPFILSSPVVSLIMILCLSCRDREWLYLGICDAFLFVLLIIATSVVVS